MEQPSDYDYNRPAKTILLDLIYFSNGLRFPDDVIEFGVPEVLDIRPDIDSDENTFIPVTVNPKYDGRYTGNTGLLYRRMRLEEVPVGDDAPKISVPFYPITTTQLLASINAHYGVQLTEDDVVDITYNTINDPIIIRFQDGSLCWWKESKASDSEFEGLISVPFLTGFKQNLYLTGFVEYQEPVAIGP